MKEYIDLGLPSGTLWADENEEGLHSYDDAVSTFKDKLPTIEQLIELKEECKWEWDNENKGYKVIGKNNNFIFLSAEGYIDYYGDMHDKNEWGYYWSSTPDDDDWECACYLSFYSSYPGSSHIEIICDYRHEESSVRLVKSTKKQ